MIFYFMSKLYPDKIMHFASFNVKTRLSMMLEKDSDTSTLNLISKNYFIKLRIESGVFEA